MAVSLYSLVLWTQTDGKYFESGNECEFRPIRRNFQFLHECAKHLHDTKDIRKRCNEVYLMTPDDGHESEERGRDMANFAV